MVERDNVPVCDDGGAKIDRSLTSKDLHTPWRFTFYELLVRAFLASRVLTLHCLTFVPGESFRLYEYNVKEEK